jgi:hypothetical protein|tara:strand:- start:266 stop:949 length:684 start_codon:yes stop_codon:yes gene_type:complete
MGMALGDGYIQVFKKQDTSKNGTKYESLRANLIMHHSIKQLEYASHKIDLLHSIFGGKKNKIIFSTQFLKKTGKTYKMCIARKGHKYFRILRKWLYPEGKKRYTRKILDMLTPHGLAIWYMDDGNLKTCHKTKTGKITSISLTISTYCSLEEAQIIRDYFNEVWQIDFSLAYHKTFNSYYMRARTQEANKFIDLVRPYMIPTMLYKVDPHERLAPQNVGDDIVRSHK